METRVLKVLSDTAVVLGAGSEHGVQEGMEFLIYELGDDIIDPETKESLGRLEIQKGRVFVISAQPKMSVAETSTQKVTRTRRRSNWDALAALTGIRVEEYEIDVRDKLKVQQKDSRYEASLVVKAGDKAKLITGN